MFADRRQSGVTYHEMLEDDGDRYELSSADPGDNFETDEPQVAIFYDNKELLYLGVARGERDEHGRLFLVHIEVLSFDEKADSEELLATCLETGVQLRHDDMLELVVLAYRLFRMSL